MNARYAMGLLSLAIGLMASAGPDARAQSPAQPRDEALDSLLEKLSTPSDGPGAKSAKSAKSEAAKSEKSPKSQEKAAKKDEAVKGSDSKAKARSEAGGASGSTGSRAGASPSGNQAGKPAAPKPAGSSGVSGKDQDLDDLLEKLGETKETPSPDDRPREGSGGEPDRQRLQPPRRGQTDRNKPTGRDKDIDEHLEELTGRRRKRNADDGQRTGKVGEIIKEMRDVEQKLGKPDTGEGTRDEQKKIVKNIDTLIEEVKRSGSTMKGLVFRRVQQPGRQSGQQQRQTGTMPRGAPLTKPMQPTAKHSNAGGQEIWGHLPAELRQEIDNQTHEEPLSAKADLIDRYYNSVGKGTLVREE
jgi:hypothetical protein